MGAQELSSLSHIGIIFYRIFLFTRPKLKKCLFPAPDWPLEDVATRNIYFFVTGNCDRKFQCCSRIYIRSWFTLLNEQNPLFDSFSLFWRKKIPLPTDPSGSKGPSDMSGNSQHGPMGNVDLTFYPKLYFQKNEVLIKFVLISVT